MQQFTTKDSKQLSSWSAAVGQYITMRRQQISLAYLDSSTDELTNNQSILKQHENKLFDSLFQSIFLILGQELEAGHTILKLVSNSNEPAPDFDSNELYEWQYDFLNKLLNPLQFLYDTHLNLKAKPNISLDNNQGDGITDKANTLKQFVEYCLSVKSINGLEVNNLDANGRKLINERLQLVFAMSEFFKHQKINLTNFVSILSKHALFSQSHSNSIDNHKNTPMAYQFINDEDGTNSNNTLVIWLARNWYAEQSISQNIKRINEHTPQALAIKQYLSSTLNEGQQKAIFTANNNAFSIITGGPGTGKTYTVAQLVIALHQAQIEFNKQSNDENSSALFKPLSLALAAPTGKAAQRMQESIQNSIDALGVEINLQEAKTIHRLLGIGITATPKYHKNNPLGFDIIIVDEASMLGVEIANHLLSAVKNGARLILLGDANQLAAVDAGAVLSDLCQLPALANYQQNLTVSRRFDDASGVGKLAALINTKTEVSHDDVINFNKTKLNKLNELLSANESLAFYEKDKCDVETIQILEDAYNNYFVQTKEMLDTPYKTGDNNNCMQAANMLLKAFNQFRVLTAGHQGSFGDIEINEILAVKHKSILKLPMSASQWYHGRPIMITANDYHQGLYNGDIGLCVQTDKGLMLYFEHKTALIPVDTINEAQLSTAYAMTIHKSQGSEFDHVAVLLDKAAKNLLSCELIYTAVTRAKQKVSIFSSQSALYDAIFTPTVRQTGLNLHFS